MVWTSSKRPSGSVPNGLDQFETPLGIDAEWFATSSKRPSGSVPNGLQPARTSREVVSGGLETGANLPGGMFAEVLNHPEGRRGHGGGWFATGLERQWGSLRDGCDQTGATPGIVAGWSRPSRSDPRDRCGMIATRREPHGCLRMASCSTRHRCLVGVREGPGAAQTRREPPRCRLALDRIGRLKRPGHSESIFVEETHHTCRLTRSPETLPTPAGTSSFSEQRLRPATTKHRIRYADWSREMKRFIAPRRRNGSQRKRCPRG
jgi:hypothetical protein